MDAKEGVFPLEAEVWERISHFIQARRWISRDQAQEWVDSETASKGGNPAPRFATTLRQAIALANREILSACLKEDAEFFDNVEALPLTSTQAKAVATFDNRVQIIASAGSGKTSVMVARAAYAVYKGWVRADRILLLAFNRAAATELASRAKERFASLGLDATGLRSTTFHEFGLAVIAQATGHRPKPASWATGGDDTKTILKMVDALTAEVPGYGAVWNSATRSLKVDGAGLARLVRSFISHTKSGALGHEELLVRANTGDVARNRAFLAAFGPVAEKWDRQLHESGEVDFEDMLGQAVNLLEGGLDMGYDLVLVDEFQDASQARVRMARALVEKPGRYLLAVGDDWQSINRFAGADISSMTRFGVHFGEHQVVGLDTTFRTTQTIADTAGKFVCANPHQIRKQVKAYGKDPGVPVGLIRLDHESEIAETIDRWIQALGAAVTEPTSVDIIGRYGFESRFAPSEVPENLSVTFRTAHKSKGLEADYVIIPRLVCGKYGFPSEIADDAVMQMVVPFDDYEHAEERRLFYVALTRAKRQVVLFTVAGDESPFVHELVEAGRVAEDPEPWVPTQAQSTSVGH